MTRDCTFNGAVVPLAVFLASKQSVYDVLLICGLVISSISVIGLLKGLYRKRRDRLFSKSAVATEGKVVAVVTYPNEDDLQSGQYKLIVDYQVEGRIYSVKSRRVSSFWDDAVGKPFGVLYDPGNPQNAMLKVDIDSDYPLWLRVGVLGIGVALVLIGW